MYVCIQVLSFCTNVLVLARVILHTARPVPQNSPHFRRLSPPLPQPLFPFCSPSHPSRLAAHDKQNVSN